MGEKRIVTVVAASGGNAVCGASGIPEIPYPTPDALVYTNRSARVRPAEAVRPKRVS